MQPPATVSGSATGPVVVAVVEPRLLVRHALTASLRSIVGLTVHEVTDIEAASLRALGPVDVVVTADASWARGMRRIDAESFDVENHVALAAAVHAAAADSPPGRSDRTRPAATDPHLTTRESAVLDCFARGLTAAEAAVELGISPSAVASAKRRVLAKLGVATPVEALRLTGRARLASDGATVSW